MVSAMSTAPVRVMSFNVRTAAAEDGADDWEHRKELVAAVLRFHRPAVAGLQETCAHQVDYLDGALADYEWVGTSREAETGAGEFVPLFYRPDRFELLGSETFWLSEVPEDPGSVGWSARHPRIATCADLRDRETGAAVTHFNTHLSHVDEHARVESARLLRRRVDAVDGPVVVTGDFNCAPGSAPYRLLAGDGMGPGATGEWRGDPLADAREVARHTPLGPTATHHEFDGRVRERIDFVFVRELAVSQYGALADHWDGRWPSDHLPVAADLEGPSAGRG